MKLKVAVVILVAALAGCAAEPVELPPAIVAVPAVVALPALASCEVQPTTVERAHGRRWQDSIELPRAGRMFLESHLATAADSFGANAFPQDIQEGIPAHLERECAELQRHGANALGCTDVYISKYHRVWTPAEGGAAGQGARGALKPTVEQELWTMNMMFKTLPPAGQKWLLCNEAGDRCVVAAAGFETGPGDQNLLGGVQGAVHWYLHTNNQTPVVVRGPLKDQRLPFGPVSCR